MAVGRIVGVRRGTPAVGVGSALSAWVVEVECSFGAAVGCADVAVRKCAVWVGSPAGRISAGDGESGRVDVCGAEGVGLGGAGTKPQAFKVLIAPRASVTNMRLVSQLRA